MCDFLVEIAISETEFKYLEKAKSVSTTVVQIISLVKKSVTSLRSNVEDLPPL
jgi:hypothetical protein